LFGHDLLLRGVQWGIGGDGKSVKITSDFWILGRPSYMLKPLKLIPSVATVSWPLDEEMREWIPKTIHAFLSRDD
jgi:hypothetical protein